MAEETDRFVHANYPLVSVAIPLSRSGQFLDSIIANLAKLEYPNLEILISDRHGYDSTIEILSERYRGDCRFKFYQATDELDWVAHFNFLLGQGSGKYFRWMPHDDSFPDCNLSEMVDYLERHTDTVIVWGSTQLVGLEGNHLRIQSEPRPSANPPWTFDISVLFNFDDYCNGAFKGLFRREVVESFRLFNKPTHQLQYSERCWIFAMSLVGRFYFMPGSGYQYQKRLYSSSTHRQWKPEISNSFSQF